jgi:hypothetical protein
VAAAWGVLLVPLIHVFRIVPPHAPSAPLTPSVNNIAIRAEIGGLAHRVARGAPSDRPDPHRDSGHQARIEDVTRAAPPPAPVELLLQPWSPPNPWRSRCDLTRRIALCPPAGCRRRTSGLYRPRRAHWRPWRHGARAAPALQTSQVKCPQVVCTPLVPLGIAHSSCLPGCTPCRQCSGSWRRHPNHPNPQNQNSWRSGTRPLNIFPAGYPIFLPPQHGRCGTRCCRGRSATLTRDSVRACKRSFERMAWTGSFVQCAGDGCRQNDRSFPCRYLLLVAVTFRPDWLW